MKKKKFDALSFIKDHRIEYTTSHQKCTTNHVNVHCPFCIGSANYHLGIHLTDKVANCWRCGGHSVEEYVKTMLNCSWAQAYYIANSYDVIGVSQHIAKRKEVVNVSPQKFKLPAGVQPLTDNHRLYLKGRRYNDRLIERVWDIKSGGVIGDFKNRIIIPIYYNGIMVSYQGRKTSKTADDDKNPKYRTCEKDKEVVFHKSILYGLDKSIGDTVVVVEGVTDVWRLGPGSVATFGINYKYKQMQLLTSFKKVYILFDSEPTAQAQAAKLADDISFISNAEVYIVDTETGNDPGSMIQVEADELMRDLLIGTEDGI